MKRIALVVVIAVAVIGAASAQGWGSNRQRASQPLTVEGTLQLQNGQIAVASESDVYYVPALQRYVGFIDGIKEGNRISIEGYAFRNIMQPVKMTVGGKTYELLANGPGTGRFSGPGGFGPGMGMGRNNGGFGCGGFGCVGPGNGYGPGRGGPGRGGPGWGNR